MKHTGRTGWVTAIISVRVRVGHLPQRGGRGSPGCAREGQDGSQPSRKAVTWGMQWWQHALPKQVAPGNMLGVRGKNRPPLEQPPSLATLLVTWAGCVAEMPLSTRGLSTYTPNQQSRPREAVPTNPRAQIGQPKAFLPPAAQPTPLCCLQGSELRRASVSLPTQTRRAPAPRGVPTQPSSTLIAKRRDEALPLLSQPCLLFPHLLTSSEVQPRWQISTRDSLIGRQEPSPAVWVVISCFSTFSLSPSVYFLPFAVVFLPDPSL